MDERHAPRFAEIKHDELHRHRSTYEGWGHTLPQLLTSLETTHLIYTKQLIMGKLGKKITNGIPANHYTRAIRVDPVRKGLLYAGTEWGMYVSFDDGANWQPFQLNLPITSIRDLHIRDNALIAATHGRSFWMMDDLGPVRQISKSIVEKGHHLFEPKPAYRMMQRGSWTSPNFNRAGKNHPNGVLFNFFIKNYDKEQKVSLTIKDAKGEVIRIFDNKTKKKNNKLKVEKENNNKFVWNMRYEGFKEFDGMVLYSSPNQGPQSCTWRLYRGIDGR